jgi:hypothetical protein
MTAGAKRRRKGPPVCASAMLTDHPHNDKGRLMPNAQSAEVVSFGRSVNLGVERGAFAEVDLAASICLAVGDAGHPQNAHATASAAFARSQAKQLHA